MKTFLQKATKVTKAGVVALGIVLWATNGHAQLTVSPPAGTVQTTGDQTVGGTKTFSNSLAVGTGGSVTYSIFGASQTGHVPQTTSDVLYSGNSTIGTSGITRGQLAVAQFEGTSASTGSMVGGTFIGASGSGSSGNLTVTTGVTPAGLVGTVARARHYGSGTVARATAVYGSVESTGVITDSAVFLADAPSVAELTTRNSHAGLWVPGGAVDGTITTNYGVRIDSLSDGDTRYAFYAQTDPSYFGGDIILNTLTASTFVEIDANKKPVSKTAAEFRTDLGVGYPLRLFSALNAVAPVDSTTYYFGNAPSVTLANRVTWANIRLEVPRGGTIKRISVHLHNATATPSNEAVGHYLRLNDTTDTTLSESETWDATAKDFVYTGLSITVATGDYIALKVVTPAWATNPTGTNVDATAWIE